MTAGAVRIDKRLAAVVLSFALLLSASAAVSVSATTEAASRTISVIVQSLTGGSAAAADAVDEVGGEVTQTLPIIDGVSARVPAGALGTLRTDERVWQVTRNGKIGFEQTTPDYSLTPARIGKVTRSESLWNQGVTGKGVTVALIDTGVYDHPDLAGRVVHCEDFSHEANTEAHCADTFGHGTFMAGLIAGNGAASGGVFKGTAPEVNIVSVKLAGFDGATDVSNVLAGLQWVVAHRNVYNIKALNLSLGSDSAQSYRLSPLNYAVQRAWKAGITVVVSAGNSGSGSRTILKPADDPLVVTVGASDDNETVAVSDDQVAVFSSRGPTRSDGLAKPDVVAPGVHTVSLRSPGSAIDQNFGANAVVQDEYFRGTGTSMSAAVVTGIVAQIIQANPNLSPDQVKNRLMSTAKVTRTTDKYAVGKGEVDAYAATRSTSTAKANGGLLGGLVDGLLSTGLGTLEGARGSLELDVTTPGGTGLLEGEVTAQFNLNELSLQNILGLVPYSGLTYTTLGWDPLSWNGVQWRNNEWAGVQWRGVQWRSTEWDGVQWRGVQWRNTDWEGVQWRDADWSGVQWRATNYMSHWYAAAWD